MANAYSLPFEAPYVGLPVGQIAQVASQINEQRMAGDDLLDNVFYEMEQTQVAPQDREGFFRLKEDLKRRMMEVADRGFGYDRLRSIRRMAREAARDLSFLQGNYAALQKNLQEIEALEATPSWVKDAYKQDLLKQYQGAFTDDGRLDTTQVFQPRTYAQAADIGRILEDAADKYNIDFKDFEFTEDGWIVTREGTRIDERRLAAFKNYLRSRLMSNPEAASFLGDLSRVLDPERLEEMVRSEIDAAIEARVNPNAKMSVSENPRFARLQRRAWEIEDRELSYQRSLEKEARKSSGWIISFGQSENILPGGYETTVRAIKVARRENPDFAEALSARLDGAIESFIEEGGLPEGVSEEAFRAQLEKIQKETPANERAFQMEGLSSELVFFGSDMARRFAGKKKIAPEMREALKAFDKHLTSQERSGFVIAPQSADAMQEAKTQWERFAARRPQDFAPVSAKDKKAFDKYFAESEFVTYTYHPDLGDIYQIAYRDEEKKLRTMKVRGKGQLASDFTSALLQTIGPNAAPIAEERLYHDLSVGRTHRDMSEDLGVAGISVRREGDMLIPGIQVDGAWKDLTFRDIFSTIRDTEGPAALDAVLPAILEDLRTQTKTGMTTEELRRALIDPEHPRHSEALSLLDHPYQTKGRGAALNHAHDFLKTLNGTSR